MLKYYIPVGPNHYADPDDDTPASPRSTNGASAPLKPKEGSVEGTSRKRRKTVAPVIIEDDEDYRPPGTKRVCSFRRLITFAIPFFAHLLPPLASSDHADMPTKSSNNNNSSNSNRNCEHNLLSSNRLNQSLQSRSFMK